MEEENGARSWEKVAASLIRPPQEIPEPLPHVAEALSLFGGMQKSEGGTASLLEQEAALRLAGITEPGTVDAHLFLFRVANNTSAEFYADAHDAAMEK